MKSLFIVTAALETATGLTLIAAPALAASLLLGATLDAAALTIARVAGVALVALGLACWLARGDVQSPAARGLLTGMTLYNVGAAGVLAHAGLGFGLFGICLWPAVGLHLALLAWCGVCLLSITTKTRNA